MSTHEIAGGVGATSTIPRVAATEEVTTTLPYLRDPSLTHTMAPSATISSFLYQHSYPYSSSFLRQSCAFYWPFRYFPSLQLAFVLAFALLTILLVVTR